MSSTRHEAGGRLLFVIDLAVTEDVAEHLLAIGGHPEHHGVLVAANREPHDKALLLPTRRDRSRLNSGMLFAVYGDIDGLGERVAARGLTRSGVFQNGVLVTLKNLL